MAEVLELSVKSNIKSVTKDTQEYALTLGQAEGNVKEINASLNAQNTFIIDLEKQLQKLKKTQDSIPEGAWYGGQAKLNEDIRNVTATIADSKLELKGLKQEQKEAKEAVKEMAKAQKEQGATLLDNIANYKVFGISLNGIKAAFGKIIPTAKLMFKTIKIGMMSTGIGALVVAFGTLVAWFSQTKVGAEALAKIFKVVGVVVKVFVDRFISYGKMLYSLITLDFKGAAANAKAAFSGVGDELSREIALAKELSNRTNALVDAERELNVETANRRAEIEDLKLAADDLNLTEEERIAKIEEAGAIETQLMADRVANAEEAVAIQKLSMTMSDNMKDDLDDLAAKEIALANIRRDSSKMQRTIQTKLNRIKKENAAAELKRQNDWIRKQNEITRANMKLKEDANEIVEELFQRGLKNQEERDKRILFNEFNKQEKIIEKSKLSELDKFKALKLLATKFETDKLKIEEEALNRKKERADKLRDIENETFLLQIEDDRKRADAELELAQIADLKAVEGLENQELLEQAIRDKYREIRKQKGEQEAKEDKERDKAVLAAKVGLAKNGLNLVSAIAGEGSKIGKAAAVAAATISGVEGVQNAFTTAQKSPLTVAMPAYPFIQAGLAGAFSAIQIQKILSGTAPSGGGGGGGGGAQTPAPQMMSGAFDISGGVEPEPTRAYVVTDEMTSSQNQLANIRRRATI
jgi:hypothetical protein|tara:strand:+ start:4304 stop:6394 length:2091 start_codon:yes stop_codon:yes gene_type:complete